LQEDQGAGGGLGSAADQFQSGAQEREFLGRNTDGRRCILGLLAEFPHLFYGLDDLLDREGGEQDLVHLFKAAGDRGQRR